MAGKDHELLVSCVHVAGVIVAIAPAGIPLTVKVTAVGKLVPEVGVMLRLYVAVPPEETVCVVTLPGGVDTLIAITVSVSVPPLTPRKFVSPL